MKLLSSKEPVATIKRTKGLHVPNEPFDKLEVETFREVNKTRKVQYPMVMKKYLDKEAMLDIKEWDVDDFRYTMRKIVNNHGNDETFTKILSNTTARD